MNKSSEFLYDLPQCPQSGLRRAVNGELPSFLGGDKPGIFEDLQVMGYRCLRLGEPGHEIRHTGCVFALVNPAAAGGDRAGPE